MSDLCKAVQTLVQRMETNPEEFFKGVKKWAFIYEEYYKEVLNAEEKNALHVGLHRVRRKELDAVITLVLLDQKKKSDSQKFQMALPGIETAHEFTARTKE